MAVKIRLTRMGAKKRPIYRIVASDSRRPRDGQYLELIGTYNPGFDNKDKELSVNKEIQGYVPRYSKIKVVGYNENDEQVTLTLTDLPSICFQHEIDHLNGIMFYDHINKENPFDVPAEYERL